MTVASPLARQYYFMWLFLPMTVLMHRAAYELRTTSRSVASVGAAVGYPAETTFSSTFRRVIGQPPGRYRHCARRAAAA